MCRRPGEEHILWQVGVNVAYSIINHYLRPPFATPETVYTHISRSLSPTLMTPFIPLTPLFSSFFFVVLSRHQCLLCGSAASP